MFASPIRDSRDAGLRRVSSRRSTSVRLTQVVDAAGRRVAGPVSPRSRSLRRASSAATVPVARGASASPVRHSPPAKIVQQPELMVKRSFKVTELVDPSGDWAFAVPFENLTPEVVQQLRLQLQIAAGSRALDATEPGVEESKSRPNEQLWGCALALDALAALYELYDTAVTEGLLEVGAQLYKLRQPLRIPDNGRLSIHLTPSNVVPVVLSVRNLLAAKQPMGTGSLPFPMK